MNYLAHILLSGENPERQFGNFIGDSVKGNRHKHFPKLIQQGILLHRNIDAFTDTHPLIKKSKLFVNPSLRHYKGVVLDVFFDHLLSVHWHTYHAKERTSFIEQFKESYTEFSHHLNAEKLKYYTHFLQADFMLYYHQMEGIERTLKGLEKRIPHKIPLSNAVDDFTRNFSIFEDIFHQFFPELMGFCSKQIRNF